MTGVLLAAGLMMVPVRETGLPLQDPLGWWLYMNGTASSEMLPQVLPAVGSGLFSTTTAEGIHRGPLGEILRRSLPPGGLEDGSTGMALTGTAAGEVLVDDGELETRTGGTGRIYVSILPGLFLEERLSLWAGSDEQPPDYFSPFHQGMEKGRHLYVDWGYLRWDGGVVAASLGRMPQRWGPGRFNQLLLSDNSPPLDMLKLELRLFEDRLAFTGLTATVDSDSGTYLVSHRLDLSPSANLRIGFSESVLFKAEGLDLAYMNPLIPWYPVQWNERVDDNAFMCLDASWKPVTDLELYGELLIDDIQYENEADRPNKLGMTAGVSVYVSPLSMGSVLEYTRIDRYVYSQRESHNYYLHHGDIIGSGLGPDADVLTLSLGTAAVWPLLTEVTVDHTRHGEGTVQEGWPDSASTGGEFPSGIVEHSTGARLHIGCYPLDFMEVHATAGNEWVRNEGHVTGVSDSRFSSSLELFLVF
ncbi:MAG: hypothetical protein AVO35_01055 [Candidatus Aegiribacteria sp. MLS_C]|nr:MAG: hypothetical protein AVO35_01055 [Candidatus Aegiribacteria sp. MLS_C]